MSMVKYYFDSKQLLLLYNSMFLSHINYCCLLYSNTYHSYLDGIIKLQKRIVRMIDGQPRLAHTGPIFKEHKLLRFQDIGKLQMILLIHRKFKQNLPIMVDEIFNQAETIRNTRNVHHFQQTFSRKLFRTHSVAWMAPRLWNNIISPRFPDKGTVPESKCIIKQLTKDYFLALY